MKMSDADILFERRGRSAWITINRPQRLNSFTLEGARQLVQFFKDANDDPDVGVIVLTGAGDRAFCTGGDIGDFENFTLEVERQLNSEVLRLSHEMRNGGKPVIARVNGFCIGAGNEINMQCDLTIAADHSKFGQTGPKMGSSPNWWATQMLPRVVGEKRAREIVYMTRQYTAADAVELGWANVAVPSERLDDEVNKWVDELLTKSPTALRLAKMAINQGSDQMVGAVMQGMESVRFFHQTGESREGMQAFLEKRPADFWSNYS
jgi:dihydroxynaphthoic acid synthetase